VRKQKASEQAQIRFVNKALNGDFKLLSMKTKSVIHTIAWIPKITATLFCVFGSGYLFAQSGQIDINRVRLMPDFPAPYLMRDWRTVAAAYDDLIFSTTATGEFLPLIHLKAEGVNYPSLQPILLDTYVGAAGMGNQAEAINIIPALVGATLVGIDKSSQNGVNWVEKGKEFFNKSNGQLVYLNGYSTTSGSDWWYDLMPNIFFYQLYSLYPDTPEFDLQLVSVADRWLEAVNAMGGSSTPWHIPQMNYRGWNLSTMMPNDSGVIEPEAAGAISWLLYHAYLSTGEKKYLIGAQLSMDFLSSLDSNPSYELQLPYGAYVAAKMNAELGTQYPLEKIVNWCFDKGPLRGWGTITGKWNDADVSGLIGEANDAGDDYAFIMNGFQQAAALIPLAKYDKRFARDIAKWALNMANASRLFYAQFLPAMAQDDYGWSTLHDANSVIAYEAVKEKHNGRALFGTGDAKREGWGQTNLGVYGSSHVGYLGSIVNFTDVDGILRLDINSTDFFGENVFPSFLLYNPHGEERQVSIPLGPQFYDIYDAISETTLKTNATGNTVVDVPALEVLMLVYLPAGTVTMEINNRLYAGGNVVDYHVGYDFTGKFRIKSLAASDTLAEFNQQIPVFATIENAPGPLIYSWYVDGALNASSSTVDFVFDTPPLEGSYTILLQVASGENIVTDSIVIKVVENIPSPPVINSFEADRLWYTPESTATIICHASDAGDEMLTYTWNLPAGALIDQTDSIIHWSTPISEGVYAMRCEVTNSLGLKNVLQYDVLVKKDGDVTSLLWAYYPLDGDVLDFSGNGHDAVLEGAAPTLDARGQQNKAFTFSSGSDIIYVNNEPSLNFQSQITISLWVKLDAVPQESFVLSHGSWEDRWKISVTPDRRIRWTVKTTDGTQDLDSSFPLQLDEYYHLAVVYSGYSMELYVNGALDAFKSATGQIGTTDKALTFGKKDQVTSNYFLRGSLDEVRIYENAVTPGEIEMLKSTWNITTEVREDPGSITLYPNPANGAVTITGIDNLKNITVSDISGRKVDATLQYSDDRSQARIEFSLPTGIIILRIETTKGIYYRKIWIP
jgi:hypothetical protein